MGSIVDVDLLRLLAILRAARVLDGVIARRQRDRFAVGAIDLRLEGKIGREALGLRGIDAVLGVADQERAGGGLVVGIEHAERDLGGGLAQ